ncbi:MAG: MerR family transcriptional regulator [Gammaproteobacteria bacterium]|nr:MerR family transcriptional regulator [Gammaproteobacteria bacterium]
MYIGKAAQLSGTTIKSIRHYEDIGLLPPAERKGKYRVYTQESVDVLRFIKCAQTLGFKLKELQAILRGYNGAAFPWELAQREIQRKKRELREQIAGMQQLYIGLEEFENSLQDAKEECHLVRAAGPEKKASAMAS